MIVSSVAKRLSEIRHQQRLQRHKAGTNRRRASRLSLVFFEYFAAAGQLLRHERGRRPSTVATLGAVRAFKPVDVEKDDTNIVKKSSVAKIESNKIAPSALPSVPASQ